MGDTIKWSGHNSTLVDRGKLTFWIPENLSEFWYSDDESEAVYSDRAIESLTTIRFKFDLTLRETEGFAHSLFKLLGLKLDVPAYSTLCRRMGNLILPLSRDLAGKKDVHVVVDSTGLKIFGEGEWKVRTHGHSKRRTWRKLHLAVDESDNQILAVVLTTNDFKDTEVLPDLMEQLDLSQVKQVTGDGAYDDKKCFNWAEKNQIQGTFPPRRGAKIENHGNKNSAPKLRDRFIRRIREIGRKRWKKESGYHRRSLAETAMFRFKILLGEKLRSRKFVNQWIEVVVAQLKCPLNRSAIMSRSAC